jgi:hypothetical protein
MSRNRIFLATALLVLLPLLVLTLWTVATLKFSYSTGERAGYLQKLSRKGWICKTWEGELAMQNLPGSVPEIFQFSVRDDRVAAQLQSFEGEKVALVYEQHSGVPSSCFAETEYFVTGVKKVGP